MRYIFLGILLLGLANCEVSDKESVYDQPAFGEFLDLNCEARKLKDERFTLAEKLRKDENYVSNPDSLKNALASQSRELAEQIRLRLDDLTGEMNLDQKRVFNDSLEARIAKIGCE
ncbi:hypothetical protein O3Q51_02475 [Cryomorphaceae bacterium 1068]|nr:hypothetical protein [Cryomorphaceae bacterium 1068]